MFNPLVQPPSKIKRYLASCLNMSLYLISQMDLKQKWLQNSLRGQGMHCDIKGHNWNFDLALGF